MKYLVLVACACVVSLGAGCVAYQLIVTNTDNVKFQKIQTKDDLPGNSLIPKSGPRYSTEAWIFDEKEIINKAIGRTDIAPIYEEPTASDGE